jgi:hypothetical protein
MRKLDVKEIHGYHVAAGLKILKLGGNAKQKAGRSQRTVADKKA